MPRDRTPPPSAAEIAAGVRRPARLAAYSIRLENLRAACKENWPFFEPGIGGELTAFAVLDPPEWFDMLQLL